jgi:hypothetical protein
LSSVSLNKPGPSYILKERKEGGKKERKNKQTNKKTKVTWIEVW